MMKSCTKDRRRSLSYLCYNCFLKGILNFFLTGSALKWFIEQWDYLVWRMVEFLCETIWTWHLHDSSLIIFLIRELPWWSCLTRLGLLLLMCISLRNYSSHWGVQIYLNRKYTNLFKYKFLMLQWSSLLITYYFEYLCLFLFFFFINLTANGRFVLIPYIHHEWRIYCICLMIIFCFFNLEIHEHLPGNLWICFTA